MISCMLEVFFVLLCSCSHFIHFIHYTERKNHERNQNHPVKLAKNRSRFAWSKFEIYGAYLHTLCSAWCAHCWRWKPIDSATRRKKAFYWCDIWCEQWRISAEFLQIFTWCDICHFVAQSWRLVSNWCDFCSHLSSWGQKNPKIDRVSGRYRL